jgi:ATP-dependent RNA circularization protein (DNA/RNA ligase family)
MADDIKVLLYPKGGEYVVYQPTPYVPTVVIVVTILSMWIFDILEKKCKQKWLASFSLGFSMIIGMATAAIIEWMVR